MAIKSLDILLETTHVLVSRIFVKHFNIPCFSFIGKIESGLPMVSLPPFSTQVGNQTYTFFDMCAHYGSGLIILPLISVLANVAIAKAFGMG